MGLDLRAWKTALALAAASACTGSPVQGPPARIIVGAADTLIVNSLRPLQIPARVLDEAGRRLPVAGLRYEWTGGDSVPVSANGTVTCTRRSDATVRVSLGSVATSALLKCRPVQSVRIAGPIQLFLGDSAQPIPAEVFGLDGVRVSELAGRVTIVNRAIATFDGTVLLPRATGGTMLSMKVGDESATVSVHVYERLGTLEGLGPGEGFVAVPLRLAPGEVRRWPLPQGQWMLTMLPYEDDRGIRLRVEGANCVPAGLTPRRIVCQTIGEARVVVYYSFAGSAPDVTGTLLVRRVNA